MEENNSFKDNQMSENYIVELEKSAIKWNLNINKEMEYSKIIY